MFTQILACSTFLAVCGLAVVIVLEARRSDDLAAKLQDLTDDLEYLIRYGPGPLPSRRREPVWLRDPSRN
jgi:hypothetical protein